jgi:hypothetical protein
VGPRREEESDLRGQEGSDLWRAGVIVVWHIKHSHLRHMLRSAALNQGRLGQLHDSDDVRSARSHLVRCRTVLDAILTERTTCWLPAPTSSRQIAAMGLRALSHASTFSPPLMLGQPARQERSDHLAILGCTGPPGKKHTTSTYSVSFRGHLQKKHSQSLRIISGHNWRIYPGGCRQTAFIAHFEFHGLAT